MEYDNETLHLAIGGSDLDRVLIHLKAGVDPLGLNPWSLINAVTYTCQELLNTYLGKKSLDLDVLWEIFHELTRQIPDDKVCEELHIILYETEVPDLERRIKPELLKKIAQDTSIAYTALANGFIENFRIMFRHGLKIDTPQNNNNGEKAYYPFIWAAACSRGVDDQKRLEMVQMLIDAGADPNTPYLKHPNPLFAVFDAEVAKLLINHGARADVLDDQGKNVLWAQYENGISGEVIHVLVESGADPGQGPNMDIETLPSANTSVKQALTQAWNRHKLQVIAQAHGANKAATSKPRI